MKRPNTLLKKENKKDGATVVVKSRKIHPDRDEIAKAAYLAWERDGRPEGRDLEYWCEAESKIGQTKPSSTRAGSRGLGNNNRWGAGI